MTGKAESPFDAERNPREGRAAGEAPGPFQRRLGWIGRRLPWHRPVARVAAITGSNDHSLQTWGPWFELAPYLARLVSLLPGKATIRPWIYRKSGGRAVPFGLLRYNDQNNRRWIEMLGDPNLYLDQLEIWSPARVSSIEQGHCPDFYFQLVTDSLANEQGVVLSLRLDGLAALARTADDLVARLQDLLAPAEVLIADRAWAERRIAGLARVNNLDDRSAFDAFEWARANPERQIASFSAGA